MRKLIVLLMALAMIVSVRAIVFDPFTDGWASCNAAGNYGGWDKDPNTCRVAWDGVTQACTDDNRDATFTVGSDGMITTRISIVHLNGISDADGFDVMDGDDVLCSYPDVPTDTEYWDTFNCDVYIDGMAQLTLHPTASEPWSGCDTWGQVAVQDITYDAAPSMLYLHGNDGCYPEPWQADIYGWGVPAIPGGAYGGEPYSEFCLVWEPGCTRETETASADLAFAGGNEVITIKHLDGMSNLDSFDVLVDGNVVGHYSDSLNPAENWVITEFPVDVAAGIHTVTIEATDDAWPNCDDWGQIAVSYIEIGPEDNEIPEFGLIAGGLAAIGALGLFFYRRKN